MTARPAACLSLLFALTLSLGVQPASPAEWRIGAVEVHPGLDSTFNYTSNLFGTRQEKDEMIFLEVPSIEGKLKLQWLEVKGGSAWRWFEYLKRPGLDRTDPHYWGGAEIQLPRLKLFAKEDYQQQAGVTFSETLSRSAVNHLQFGASPQFKRLKLDFVYSDESTNYKPPNLESDRDITKWTWKLGYPIWPKTDLTAEYIFGNTRYPRKASRNYRAHSWYLGAEGRYWAKLTGEAKVGLEFRDAIDRQQNEDLTGVVSSVDLTWRHSKYRKFEFLYERQFRDATFEASKFGAFLGHAVTFSLEQYLTYRLISTWSVAYSWEKGTVPTSADDLSAKQRSRGWAYQAELEYRFRKWLTGTVGMGYSDQDSNFNNNDSTTFSVQTGVKIEL